MDKEDSVSDNERRRVADTLRFRASEGTANPLVTLKSALGFCQDKTYRDVFRALANLIDRPTCRAIQPIACSFYECSVCGYDEWATTASIDNYCPHCGALVVGDGKRREK